MWAIPLLRTLRSDSIFQLRTSAVHRTCIVLLFAVKHNVPLETSLLFGKNKFNCRCPQLHVVEVLSLSYHSIDMVIKLCMFVCTSHVGHSTVTDITFRQHFST